MPEAVRWNVTVSQETDAELRALLRAQGRTKGDLSRFVEQAVRAQVFHKTVRVIKARNAALDARMLEADIDSLVRQVRAQR